MNRTVTTQCHVRYTPSQKHISREHRSLPRSVQNLWADINLLTRFIQKAPVRTFTAPTNSRRLLHPKRLSRQPRTRPRMSRNDTHVVVFRFRPHEVTYLNRAHHSNGRVPRGPSRTIILFQARTGIRSPLPSLGAAMTARRRRRIQTGHTTSHLPHRPSEELLSMVIKSCASANGRSRNGNTDVRRATSQKYGTQ